MTWKNTLHTSIYHVIWIAFVCFESPLDSSTIQWLRQRTGGDCPEVRSDKLYLLHIFHAAVYSISMADTETTPKSA